MTADGKKPAAVYDAMLERGENVVKSDINNFMYAMRKLGADDNEAVVEQLKKLRDEDPDAVITVDETDRLETGVISITTKHMRGMFERFGEMILVDCTHKTNRYNYQLCTIMVMDEFGCGQVVQQSLFETNGDWHMFKAIDHLKRANASSHKMVRVIMVDKDLNEVKYLSTVKYKPEFGKLSADDYSVIDNHIHRLVYAVSGAEFDNNRVAFEAACERLKFSEFAVYVRRNWFSCTEMWVMWERARLPHLRNHTNNRLESWFGKFKNGVTEKSTMSQCIDALLKESRRCKNEYDHEFIRQGRFFNANYDEELNNVLLCSTPFVAKVIEPEYAAALNKFASYQYEVVEKDNSVVVKGASSLNTVSLIDFACGCEHSMTMRLLCRHAMAYRKHTGQGTVVPLKRIDVRWKRQSCVVEPVEPFVYNKSELARVEVVDVPRAGAERYKEAMRLLQPICSELAEIEDESEFKEYIGFLQAQYRNIRKRKRIAVVEDEDDAARPTSLVKRNVETLPVASDPDQVAHGDVEHPVELSQTNSLYSADVGDVPPPDLRALHMSSLADIVAEDSSRATPGDDSAIPAQTLVQDGSDSAPSRDVDASHTTALVVASAAVQDATVQDVAIASEAVQDIVINLNENAPRTGRPPNVRVQIEAAVRAERVRFNAAEEVRQETGELSMSDVLDALDREQPGLTSTANRLRGIKVKFAKYENNKPKYLRLREPTLNEDCYYVLPPKLLNACVHAFPVGTRPGEAIRVGTPDRQNQSAGNEDVKGLVEVVKINSVGMFSRAQIETMQRAENLIAKVAEGREFVKWLRIDVGSMVDPTLKPTVELSADLVESLFPDALLDGLPDYTGFEVAALYRVRPPAWYSDGLISAFCARLQQVFTGVKLAGVLSLSQPSARGRRQPALAFTEHLITRIRTLTAQDDTTHVLVPVNFGDAHWTSLWINVGLKEVKYYDSKPTPARQKALESLACILIDDGVPVCSEYTAVAINNPIQFDGYSCGLFVCLRFWWDVDRTAPREATPRAIELRRYDMVHFILHGRRPGMAARQE